MQQNLFSDEAPATNHFFLGSNSNPHWWLPVTMPTIQCRRTQKRKRRRAPLIPRNA